MDQKPIPEEIELELVHIGKPHRQNSFLRDFGSPQYLLSSPDDERDYLDLMRLGKTPVLKRNFGFIAIFTFTCTIMGTWGGVLLYYGKTMMNGGPAGMIYGFIIAWIGISSVYACLSELSSMAPTAGGQYFWVSMLAPTSTQRLFSYLTGWITLCGWHAAHAAAAFLAGDTIQALSNLTSPHYTPAKWQTTILMWAGGLFALFFNAFSRTILPRFEGLVFLVYILGFFAVLISLTVLGSYNQPSTVFKGWINEGGWPTQGLSFMIGLLLPIFGFAGVDAPIHMAEEIHNASMTVPRAIMLSTALNGLMGLVVAIVIAFTVTDIKAALSIDSSYPILVMIQKIINSTSGTAALMSAVIVVQINGTIATLACASRLLWAFSRDRGVPGWQKLQQVDQRKSLPIRSMCASSAIMVVLSLIVLGSPNAFNIVISISIAGLYASYIFPIALLLWRRITSGITSISAAPSDGVLFNSSGKQLVWGPWHVPGVWGIINNAFACGFIFVVWVFSFFPTELPVDAESMNYSSVIFAGVLLAAMGYYFWRGRKEYVGPVIEVGAQ